MASLTRAMCCMIYEIIVFENLRFQKLHSGDRFCIPAFLVPENAGYLRVQISVFKFLKASGCLWTEHFFFLNHRAVNSPNLILISANANLYHVTKFPLHLPFTFHYFYT